MQYYTPCARIGYYIRRNTEGRDLRFCIRAFFGIISLNLDIYMHVLQQRVNCL